jgi:hypothetical protein
VGCDSYIEIAEGLNLKRYITATEYGECYPEIFPLAGENYASNKASTREKIKHRLRISDDDFSEYLQVHAIFILIEPIYWEDGI